MPAPVSPVPKGFHTLTPHLVVKDAPAAIEFYKQAFGAEVGRIHYTPDGQTITHADLRIGDSMLMLCGEFPAWGVLSPLTLGGTPVTLHVYVADPDALFGRAVAAGATVKMPLADQFWGDRYGQLTDPFGHLWSIAARIAEPSEEELKAASEAAFAKLSEPGA
jgi:uncharacterized glyoxalase superfamily protein PhnB